MVEVARRTFTIVRCLGRGGFGEVYRAVMSSPGGISSDVAVKVLRRDLDPRGQAVQRLRDEGRVLARLRHPTILRVHDLLLLDGRISLVTELVDGEDLADLFGADLPARALVEVIGQVASALDAAWSAPMESGAPLRLVHRDIKPSNIRVSRHGEVKLLDFGIARADSVQREARTQTDMLVGSPAYMAPERYVDATIRPESDVFSLGASLYEGLAGRRFYDDLPVPMLATLAIDDERYAKFLDQRLRRLKDTPAPLLDLLRRTLAFEPDDRLDARALAQRCEALADELPGASLARWCRERAWPDPPEEVGELDGQTLTEGTLAQASLARTAPASAPTTSTAELVPPSGIGRAPARGVGLLAGGMLVFGVFVVLLGIGGVVGGFVLGMGTLPTDPEPAAAEPAPADALAPTPAPSAPTPNPSAPTPTPSADPEPTATPPEPEPSSAEPERTPPAPTPKVAAPAPAPRVARTQPTPPSPTLTPSPVSTPSSAPTPAPTTAVPPPTVATAAASSAPAPEQPPARVTVSGEATVVLVAGGARYPLPADVPAGTYEVLATFAGRGEVVGKPLTLAAGARVELRCSPRMYTCDPR